MRVRRALLSVHDKTGILEFARGLVSFGVTLVASAGTCRALGEGGVDAVALEDLTGFAELLGGRVKTLHPAVHAGILARDEEREATGGAGEGYEPFDLVAVTLYPFEEGLAKGSEDLEELVDIGGPAMLRAAAKNWRHVGVLCDPDDYTEVLVEMRARDASLGERTRRRLAAKVFRRTSVYDAAVAGWLEGGAEEGGEDARLDLHLERARTLRYGENPHQAAALYVRAGLREEGVARAEVLQGKPLSYNNLLDADAALDLLAEIGSGVKGAAAVVVKHVSPCGAALAPGGAEALDAALATDPVSAFGGVLGLSVEVDRASAERIAAGFYEIVLAPSFSEGAREVLASKKNLRLLVLPLPDPGRPGTSMRSVSGGFLVQDRDALDVRTGELRVVTRRRPDDAEWRALRFAWRVCKHVRSNAIVFAGADRVLGIGGGQPSRVGAARIAARSAGAHGHDLQGSAAASDAFFPFRDGVDVLAEAGATCVIQPGGSVRDGEVVAAADQHGMAMVLTGIRHFRH